MPSTPEGDDLLRVIRELIHGRVHPSQEEVTTEIVAHTVVIIMSDPKYYSHLKLVIDLQSRIIQLERALSTFVQPKQAAKRLPTKGPARPPVRKVSKKAPPSNVKQFRRGASGK